MPAAHFAATDGSFAVQGLESQQRQGAMFPRGSSLGGEVSAGGQEEHRLRASGYLGKKRSTHSAYYQGHLVRVLR